MLLGAAILTVRKDASPTAGGGCVEESLVLNKLARLGYAAQRAGRERGQGSGTGGFSCCTARPGAYIGRHSSSTIVKVCCAML